MRTITFTVQGAQVQLHLTGVRLSLLFDRLYITTEDTGTVYVPDCGIVRIS